MKKLLFMVTALVLLVLTYGFAEESTWSNPDDLLFGTYHRVPRSMLSAVSNGVYYDEIDTVVLSPAELSNYSGFTIFTAYGNYEFDYLPATGYINNFLNPFSDTTITDGTNIGDYKLGATGELFGFRGGLLGSFSFDQDNNLSMSGGTSNFTNQTADTEDLDADATADYSWSGTENYTDYSAGSTLYGGAGVDLDFLGMSLYGSVDNNNRVLGGSYVYTYTSNQAVEDTYVDPADVITSKSVYYGSGAEGAVSADPYNSYTNWIVGARAQLPLTIAEISMPVKADFCVGSQWQTVAGVYNPAMATSYNATSITGITDTTKANSITQTVGQAMSTAGWNAQTVAGILDSSAAAQAYTQANFRTLANATPGAAYAMDTANFSNINFITGVDALIDPRIEVTEVFSLRTRGQFGYMFGVTGQNNAGLKSVSYSEAVEVSATPSVYTYSSTVTAPTTTLNNTIDLELGGLMDLHNEEGTLSVSSGVFYHPNLQLQGTSAGNKVTSTSVSWKDESAAPDAEVTGIADTIGPGSFQGTRTDVTTQTWTDGMSQDVVTFENNFYIPTSTRVVLAEGGVELVGGYLLRHSTTTTTTTTHASTTATATSIADSTGTALTLTTPATTSTGSSSNVKMTDSGWSGQMSWMLRWNVMKGMTVDFFGASIMSALNFDMFGDDGAAEAAPQRDGLNFFDIIDNLGMSVTISAE